MTKPLNLLWLQSGGCGGCTLSLLNAEQPHMFALLEESGIRLLWHPSLSQESGSEALVSLKLALRVGNDWTCFAWKVP